MTNLNERSNPVYSGFAESPPDLYEFRTESGAYVFLHELECVGVAYLPLARTLTITFEGGPTELVSAMTVALTFAGAEIYRWESVGEAANEERGRFRGQVGAFHTEKERLEGASEVSFHLSLLDVAISFFAEGVACEVS